MLHDPNQQQTIPVRPIQNTNSVRDLNKIPFIAHPKPSDFSICYNHTCNDYAFVSLNNNEWNRIRKLFEVNSLNPVQEREIIKKAIAYMEQIVGEKTGTDGDKGENFSGLGQTGQMDCVDESTNTTVYLTMLQNDSLLKWHTVSHRTSRGILSLQAPHFTAVIVDQTNQKRYAVDSWFLDNGQPPFIVPLDEWQDGWDPS